MVPPFKVLREKCLSKEKIVKRKERESVCKPM
jgi:hypothetical protein